MTGFQGRENAYECDDCGGFTVTIDRDDGVTPMFLACRASGNVEDCTGRAVSSGYPMGPRPSHIPEPAWEWYRPTQRQTRRLDPASRDYVERGGLMLRKTAKSAVEEHPNQICICAEWSGRGSDGPDPDCPVHGRVVEEHPNTKEPR